MKPYWMKAAPNAKAVVLVRREKSGHRHRRKRAMKRQVEVGVLPPQAREHQGLWATTRHKKETLSWSLQRERGPPDS